MPYSQRPPQELDYDDDIQKAMAASLQDTGAQLNGVTGTGQQFGPANRSHYDPKEWAMMPTSNATTDEVVVHPEPEDRQREEDTPAFVRPNDQLEKLNALLTILHSIPLSREALLLRDSGLSDYGHNAQWWSGVTIAMPKIVSLDQPDPNDGWEDVLYECQRVMAFLDGTKRAYGSVDQFRSITFFQESPEPTTLAKFFDSWFRAAVYLNRDNMLAASFNSTALKMPLDDLEEPVQKDFFCLEAPVEPYEGQTIYDVLDRTIWADQIGDDLDDVWIQNMAEVFTLRFFADDRESEGLKVEIPAVWYPDRYLDECKDISQQLRRDKMEVELEKRRIENRIGRFQTYHPRHGPALQIEEILKIAASSAEGVVKDHSAANTSDSMDLISTDRTCISQPEAQKCAEELKTLAAGLAEKVQGKDCLTRTCSG